MANKIPIFGTPGFRSSEGDRLISSLCDLWRRIQTIQQFELSTKESKSADPNCADELEKNLIKETSGHKNKGTQTKLKEPKCDISLVELQMSLLQLQLRYLQYLVRRGVLRSNSHTIAASTNTASSVAASSEINNSDIFSDLDVFPVKLKCSENHKSSKVHKSAKETNCVAPSLHVVNQASQTEVPLLQEVEEIKMTPPSASLPGEHIKENRFELELNDTVPKSLSRPSSSYIHSECAKLPVSKHGHHHMKLTDVPFILGTSTTPSHSVTASVQHIIGMLKTHTVLCTSTPKLQKSPPKTFSKSASTKFLKALRKEFDKLSLEHEKLKEQLALNKNEPEVKIIREKYKSVSELLNAKAKEIIELHGRIPSETTLKPKKADKMRLHSETSFNPCWKGAKNVPVKVVK